MASLSFSSDGKLLLVGAGGVVTFWDLDKRAPRMLLSSKPIRSNLACYAPKSPRVAIAQGRAVEIWDTASAKLLYRLEDKTNKSPSGPTNICFAPDGQRIAIGRYDGAVDVWSVNQQRRLYTVEQQGVVRNVSFFSAGRMFAVVRDGDIRVAVYSSDDGALVDSLTRPPEHQILCVAPIGSGGRLAIEDRQHGLALRDVTTRQEQPLPQPANHNYIRMTCLACRADGAVLFAGANDGTVNLWDVDRRVVTHSFRHADYSFVLRAPPPQKQTHGIAERTLAAARREGRGYVLEIRRSGVTLQSLDLPSAAISPGPLRMVASRDAEQLALQVNDQKPLTFLDPFPLGRAAESVFGVRWPQDVGLQRLAAQRLAAPSAPSPLERGDELYESGQFAAALEQYRRQAIVSGGGELAQQALYKQAACLEQIGRRDEAKLQFQALAVQLGDRWPVLAACQLWIAALDPELPNSAEAAAILDNLSARYDFEQLSRLVPHDLRQKIVEAYGANLTGINWIKPNADRVRTLERAVEVERLWLGAPESWSLHSLLRAYVAQGRRQEALEFAKRTIESLKDSSEFFAKAIRAEYTWLLRSEGRAEEALKELDRWSRSETGIDNIAPGHEEMAIERARTLAALRALGRSREHSRAVSTRTGAVANRRGCAPFR